MPGPSEPSTRRARTCSEAAPKTASITAWVPHSISCNSRTFGNAPRPRVLREARNAASFAGLSGTSSMVASHDTSRSPARNAPAAPGAACAPRSRANNPASGATQTRRGRCHSIIGVAVRQLPPHAAVPLPMEQGQRENEPHHRPRRQPSYPLLQPAGIGQHLIDQGSRDMLRQYPQPHALPHRHARARSGTRRGIMSNHEAPVLTSVLVDRRSTGASPSPQPATPRRDHTAEQTPRARRLPGTTLIFPALGVRWQVLYPGMKLVTGSTDAERWSRELGLPFYEAVIETIGHKHLLDLFLLGGRPRRHRARAVRCARWWTGLQDSTRVGPGRASSRTTGFAASRAPLSASLRKGCVMAGGGRFRSGCLPGLTRTARHRGRCLSLRTGSCRTRQGQEK